MPVSKNHLRNSLSDLLRDYAENEGTDLQSALRDALTDLQHIADAEQLDWEKALVGSEEVYNEECDFQVSDLFTGENHVS